MTTVPRTPATAFGVRIWISSPGRIFSRAAARANLPEASSSVERPGTSVAVSERVVGEDQRRHRLHHRYRAWQHARVMAAAALDGRVDVVGGHGALLPHDRRGRLERDAEVDRLAVRDAALHPARAVGARAHAAALHVELVVVLRAAQVGAGEARADLEALAGGQAQHRFG